MSHAATTWAFALAITPATTKFVLVALADYANRNWLAWPTVAALEAKTCLNEKTILEALKRLRDLGFIEDTGDRFGKTKSIPIYGLKHTRKRSTSENGVPPKTEEKHPQKRVHSGQQVLYTEPSSEPLRVNPSNLAKSSNGQRNEDWLEKLRTIYTWVPNFDEQVGKAKAYLLLPKCQGRKFTQTYFTRWLNRIDRPMDTPQKEWTPPEKSWRSYHEDD